MYFVRTLFEKTMIDIFQKSVSLTNFHLEVKLLEEVLNKRKTQTSVNNNFIVHRYTAEMSGLIPDISDILGIGVRVID